MKYIFQSVVALFIFSVIAGVVYPLFIYVIGQTSFNFQANGSILYNQNNQPIGSLLIGQQFSGDQYFWSRPSATANYPYNALASGGSNLGPLNPQLESNVRQYIALLGSTDHDTSIPVDLVTTSGSGLDPEISLAAAYYQIPRVAKARKMPTEIVRKIIEKHIQYPMFGILGEVRVNVLSLNLALDQYKDRGQ